MPTEKKTTRTQKPRAKQTTTPPVVKAEQEQEPELKTVEPKVCGHVNRHSMGTDRKLDNMTCDLPKGHSGDHSGVHEEMQRVENTQILDGHEVTDVTYESVEVRRGWNNMAGIPVSEIPAPDPVNPPTMLELEERIKKMEQQGAWTQTGKPLSQVLLDG